MRPTLFFCLLCLLLGLAKANPSSKASDLVLEAVHKLDPTAAITSRTQGPLPDMVTVMVNSQPLYVTKDGRFIVQGQIYDLQKMVNITEKHQSVARVNIIRSVPMRDRIIFTPPMKKYRVVAFVDIDCGFCHQLLKNLDGYLAQGIEIDFLAYPRAGLNSDAYKEAVSVWCSADPRHALREAYIKKPAGGLDCVNPVASELKIAQDLSIAGTPGIIAEDGTIVGGYLSPTELRKRLDGMQTQAKTP